MSKIAGHKVQLALAVLKGRREEVRRLQENAGYGEYNLQDYKQAIESRLEQLDAEIETFENNLKKVKGDK